ncbi:hypothetical protein [uncultured Treponema sp.]|uniref:hypothetical protein n=1 Tax=uncultured Treponema sp. TaxID=162155 RepID=UPI0025D5E2EC|nr:hypothetical protein [uncultured Treponema sp.]
MTRDDIKEYLNKSVEASKQALDKAGKAVSKFGDESILKIEIQQLKSQIKKDKAELGELAYKKFMEENAASLASDDENVVKILESIKNSLREIQEREGKLKVES